MRQDGAPHRLGVQLGPSDLGEAGRAITVYVDDRGPFIECRVRFQVSKAA